MVFPAPKETPDILRFASCKVSLVPPVSAVKVYVTPLLMNEVTSTPVMVTVVPETVKGYERPITLLLPNTTEELPLVSVLLSPLRVKFPN